MQIFRSSRQVEASPLLPTIKPAVLSAIRTLEEIFGNGFDNEEYGYVVLIEKNDTPKTVKDHQGHMLFEQPLEGVFIQDGCLQTVTLWGNSGAGVTWICPDQPEYAPEISMLLKAELPNQGG